MRKFDEVADTITDKTITLAVDTQGGMCDRLMLGEQGIINNAKISLECWKLNAPDDEDTQSIPEPKTVREALGILWTDNFYTVEVKTLEEIQEHCQDKNISLDLNNIEFTDNMYKIY